MKGERIVRDKNLDYASLTDGKVKATPKEGYKMLCKLTKSFSSEAIITAKQENNFISVKK